MGKLASEPPARRLGALETGLAVLVTALSLALHLAFLFSAGALWRDEVNSVSFAEMPSLADVWRSLDHEAAPLAAVLALRAWTAAGFRSDFELRIFGTLVGAALLGALWLFARRTTGRAPLWSLVLLGLSPMVVRYGDSLRSNGLAATALVLAAAFIYEVASRPGRAGALSVALATAASVLAVQTTYAAAPLLFAICLAGALVALAHSRWRRALLIPCIGLAAALSLLPYLPAIARGRDALAAAGASVGFSRLLSTLFDALGSGRSVVLTAWLALAALGVIAAIVAALRRGAPIAGREQRDFAFFSGTAIAAGTAAFLLFMGSTDFTPQPWHFLPLLALVAPCLESVPAGLLDTRASRIARVVLVALLTGSMALPAWREVRVRQTNVDRIARALAEEARPSDLVVVAPWFFGVSFRRYYEGPAAWTTVPPIADLAIHRYDLLKEQMASARPLDPVFAGMQEALRSGGRVWLVGAFSPPNGSPRSLPPAPQSPAGWNSGPYLTVWSEQVAFFAGTRARSVRLVPLPREGPVDPHEDLPLYRAEGWVGK